MASTRIRLVLSSVALAFSLATDCYAGSFFNPTDSEYQEAGEEATASLDEGLANFLLMLSRLEAGDTSSASGHAGAAIEALEFSQGRFSELLSFASDEPLSFEPRNEREQEAIKQISYLVTTFGLSEPLTDRQLFEFSANRISAFLEYLQSVDTSDLSPDGWRSRRAVIEQAVDLQWVGLVVSDLWAASAE